MSPSLLAEFWFAAFRLVWAIYWFGFQMPQQVFVFKFSAGILPIALSTLAAGYVGHYLGVPILDPARTRSYWMAGLRGILVQHATTLFYLPIAALLSSLAAHDAAFFLPSLGMSLLFSLAGIPIHTILGAVAGVGLYIFCQNMQRTGVRHTGAT